MIDALLPFYDWVKAAHVVAVIAWMAGLLYLPRLFVYHAERGAPGSELDATFQVMERRLLKAIVNPAMVATLILGGLMALMGGFDWGAAWTYAKLASVLGLLGVHGWLAARRREFAEGRNTRPSRTYRIANEVPTVLMVVIVAAVVVKF